MTYPYPVPKSPSSAYWPESESAYRDVPEWALAPVEEIDPSLYGEFPGTAAIPFYGQAPQSMVQSLTAEDLWMPQHSLTDAGAATLPVGGLGSLSPAELALFCSQAEEALASNPALAATVDGEARAILVKFCPALAQFFAPSSPLPAPKPDTMPVVISEAPTGFPTASADQAPSKPVWPWVVGGIGVLGVLGGLYYLMRKKRRRNPSRAARRFVSSDIRRLRRRGYGQKQASAIAYSQARRKGYRVGRRR